MAYVEPVARAAGYVIPSAEWVQNTVDNPIAIRALQTGGTLGQILTAAGGGAEATWATAADSGLNIIQVEALS